MYSRILYLIGQLSTGGSERQLYNLLQAMDRERYRPGVIVWNFREEDFYVSKIRALGVRLVFFDNHLTKIGKLTFLRAMVGRDKPEVIHSYSFFTRNRI